MRGLVFFALLVTRVTQAYIWPSPKLDSLESLRFDLDRRGAVGFLNPCDVFIFDGSGSGRSDAADWIRTAYHDMATHNVEDGTGGMDGSIRFAEEQARAENAGDGFGNTVGILFGQVNRYISVADALAMGAVMAYEHCGGPEIAFRGGRVDAVGPNNPGVPEPEQSLDSHIASFARQGFTQTEMIGLVACGHTFGGVQHDPFPDIVPVLNDPTSHQDVLHFDSTNTNFDNNVATEYITDTTKNPLVVGFNDTTNSDKRIFGSDGNVTMRSFANSPPLFASTCADLIARMIDTVPRGVKLTEVITPLLVKPDGVQLALNNDTLELSGEVRLWNATENASRTVRLLWNDRVRSTHNATLLAGEVDTNFGRTPTAWYVFSDAAADSVGFLAVDAKAGITNMHFVVDGKVEDQGGVGFAVDDRVVFSKTSCRTSSDTSSPAARFDVGVRNGVHPTRVYLEQDTFDDVPLPIIVETNIPPPPPAHPGASGAAYTIWSVTVAVNVTNPFDTIQYSIGAEIDGVKITDFNGNGNTNGQHVLTDLPLCAGVSR
ncbi:heme peroxidase [Mycena leptocephala]|nr:heme peroxidase [Mycena leptocephala]